MDSVKNDFTIDQVYLFYEKSKIKELEYYRMMAIVSAQALIYTSPVYDKKEIPRKRKTWREFMDSLSVNTEAKKQKKKSPSQLFSLFGKVGMKVPDKKKWPKDKKVN